MMRSGLRNSKEFPENFWKFQKDRYITAESQWTYNALHALYSC